MACSDSADRRGSITLTAIKVIRMHFHGMFYNVIVVEAAVSELEKFICMMGQAAIHESVRSNANYPSGIVGLGNTAGCSLKGQGIAWDIQLDLWSQKPHYPPVFRITLSTAIWNVQVRVFFDRAFEGEAYEISEDETIVAIPPAYYVLLSSLPLDTRPIARSASLFKLSLDPTPAVVLHRRKAKS